MEALYAAVSTAIADWMERTVSVRPFLKLSQRAMLASSDFLRADAAAVAETLTRHISDCTLLDAPLVRRVWAENGWLLFSFDRAAFDAFAQTLPDAFPHGDGYVDRRMELLNRHPDAPLPDCDAILTAVLCASFASQRGRWTQADERAVLTMTHGLHGMERVYAEHAAARAAKIILYERRNLP